MATAPNLFSVPSDETLSDQCSRLAGEIDEYERDILRSVSTLNLTEIRQVLERASVALRGSRA